MLLEKELDSLWLICSFNGHLGTYVNSISTIVVSLVFSSLLMMYVGLGWLCHVWWTMAAISSDCNVVNGECHVFAF